MITIMTMIATASKLPITPPAIAPPEPPPSVLVSERPIIILSNKIANLRT